MRIGVFGGAFDPPHLGHLALARAALTQLALDELKIFPTGVAWHKTRDLSPAPHRVAMTRLAFEGMERVSVDERETRRAGPTYTFDTLSELRREAPMAEFFLLLGLDQALALPQWHRGDEMAQLACICVVDRATPGSDATPSTARAPTAPPHFRRLEMEPVPTGSTPIRARVQAGQDITGLVPPSIARYIAQHHLYLKPR